MGNRIMMEGLEERRLLSGVTLVTHGYQLISNQIPIWTIAMADDVADRAGSDASIFNLRVNYAGSNLYVESFTKELGPGPANSTSGESVIFLDWAPATGVIFSYFSTASVAQLIAPYFRQTFASLGINKPFAESPIHLVGHSRGASLVSSLAGELGQQGIWVDQLTTLDPHPVNSDPEVTLGNNILFADNFFQSQYYPEGSSVEGAHNTDLTFLGLDHSDTHAFYDGTIYLAADDDGGDPAIAIDPSWYLYSGTGPRSSIGYAWSRIGGSARPTSGAFFAGAPRTPASLSATGSDVWDNIVITGVGASVTRGNPLAVQTKFLDLNRDATITVGFDADSNPDNGVSLANAAQYRNTNYPATTAYSLSAATSSLFPTTYRVFAKISNGTHTRYYYAPGAVTITPDTTKPSASASVSNVSGAGGTSHSFNVTYSDNIAIKGSTIDSGDVRVTGPSGFNVIASLVSVSTAGDGTPRTATYKFTPPGGSWDSADNGTYRLTLQANQVTDTSGNAANSVELKSFSVNVPPPSDVARPTAVAAVANVTAAGGTSHPFTVTYSDVIAVKRSTIDSFDIRVTGPNGFNVLASLKSISGAGDSSSLDATYQFTPPGGSWNSADNGTYTLALVGNQISNTSGYFANAVGSLKTFSVSIVTTPPTTGRISGAVFIDKNGDGIQNRGDKGTAGWTLWLDLDKDGVRDSGETVGTDSLGSFAFIGVAPGTYVLRLLARPGWVATTRTRFTITVAGGQAVKGVGFGQRAV